MNYGYFIRTATKPGRSTKLGILLRNNAGYCKTSDFEQLPLAITFTEKPLSTSSLYSNWKSHVVLIMFICGTPAIACRVIISCIGLLCVHYCMLQFRTYFE